MQITFRRLFLLPFVVLALLVGACQPTAEVLPRLEDPKEILEEALRTTAELDFIHAKLDVTVTGPDLPQPAGATIEGDLDLDRRDFHAVMEGNALLGGQGRVEVLLVGTETYTRFEGMPGAPATDKWSRSTLGGGNDPRAGIPPTPAIAVALKTVLEDPSVDAVLKGSEACGESQCYQVELTVASELIGRAMSGGLFGPGGGDAGPGDPTIPDVVLDIQIEESTRRLVSVGSTTTVQGMTVTASASFTNHDVQVSFLPPPPDQVDDNSGGLFGQEQILESVGNEVFEGP